MKALSILPFIILMSIGTVITGCGGNEGPAEQAGEEIDNAVESTGEAIEEAGDELEEKTQ
jgi:hypothetical protein